LLAYLIIMLTHLRYRTRFGCPPKGHCQMSGFPYTTWLAVISLFLVIVTMPLIPGQGSGLLAGLILVALYSVIFVVRSRSGQRVPAPAKPIFEKELEDGETRTAAGRQLKIIRNLLGQRIHRRQ
ncbi:MAG TPA: hypothetical protein VHQ70_07090, partial [Syntrophomonadaceae bacterium]|nr:hypothetical protein [Syntrophomonadaceae bacterium]